MEGLELQCFQIISAVGMARSSYIEAIQSAKKGDFDRAKEQIAEGEQSFLSGHAAHAEMIQQEAAGNHVQTSLLLMHAEDQLMSAETFKIIAQEMIQNYERITALEAKVNE